MQNAGVVMYVKEQTEEEEEEEEEEANFLKGERHVGADGAHYYFANVVDVPVNITCRGEVWRFIS